MSTDSYSALTSYMTAAYPDYDERDRDHAPFSYGHHSSTDSVFPASSSYAWSYIETSPGYSYGPDPRSADPDEGSAQSPFASAESQGYPRPFERKPAQLVCGWADHPYEQAADYAPDDPLDSFGQPPLHSALGPTLIDDSEHRPGYRRSSSDSSLGQTPHAYPYVLHLPHSAGLRERLSHRSTAFSSRNLAVFAPPSAYRQQRGPGSAPVSPAGPCFPVLEGMELESLESRWTDRQQQDHYVADGSYGRLESIYVDQDQPVPAPDRTSHAVDFGYSTRHIDGHRHRSQSSASSSSSAGTSPSHFSSLQTPSASSHAYSADPWAVPPSPAPFTSYHSPPPPPAPAPDSPSYAGHYADQRPVVRTRSNRSQSAPGYTEALPLPVSEMTLENSSMHDGYTEPEQPQSIWTSQLEDSPSFSRGSGGYFYDDRYFDSTEGEGPTPSRGDHSFDTQPDDDKDQGDGYFAATGEDGEYEDVKSVVVAQRKFQDRFPDKLYVMLDDPECQPHLFWAPDGRSIMLPRPADFERYLTSSRKYFNHGSLGSFLRQMNIYGFSKTRTGPKKRDDWNEQKSVMFDNPVFFRGCGLENIANIRRMTPNRRARKLSNASSIGDPSLAAGSSSQAEPVSAATPALLPPPPPLGPAFDSAAPHPPSPPPRPSVLSSPAQHSTQIIAPLQVDAPTSPEMASLYQELEEARRTIESLENATTDVIVLAQRLEGMMLRSPLGAHAFREEVSTMLLQVEYFVSRRADALVQQFDPSCSTYDARFDPYASPPGPCLSPLQAPIGGRPSPLDISPTVPVVRQRRGSRSRAAASEHHGPTPSATAPPSQRPTRSVGSASTSSQSHRRRYSAPYPREGHEGGRPASAPSAPGAFPPALDLGSQQSGLPAFLDCVDGTDLSGPISSTHDLR